MTEDQKGIAEIVTFFGGVVVLVLGCMVTHALLDEKHERERAQRPRWTDANRWE